ncbi:potassium transporter Kup [Lichenicola cladoniae]|uniref:Probable potassium transport system protein Kup n=1 Tax=Lichenicola cladoniae TaxID=1484109 RepID=A0A6M8HUV5_9PROT|nr:potassium transporter Kup [Lichenicola cladoniae]NPD69518.1 potassium transporter Kup [Acetobacteraceae bacterium]QKE92118.1 potassium transporter Kup [Lichenicola cladoniae]
MSDVAGASGAAPSGSATGGAAAGVHDSTTEPAPGTGHGGKRNRAVTIGSLLAVLGVVYGDIGTSPLYALKATLQIVSPHANAVTRWEVLGLESLIFWSLVLVVTIKYVTLIMRADNNGEGGILALMALAQRVSPGPQMRRILGFVGIIGACLFFGDGTITPAISVLSAVEGLEVSMPSAAEVVLPIAVVVIVALFSMQWRGTGSVGRIFGPIMLLWFVSIGILGAVQVARFPFVLQALLPHHAAIFIWHHGWLAFVALGAVVLAVTGAEALYADMGHFGRRPIRVAWLGLVLPALALNYLGQGALIIEHPGAMANPFFLLCPHWLRLPMVILATMATVIASQAMITGAYSIARQMVQLGYFPRMRVLHTNADEEGQIYVPQVNWALLVGVLVLVLSFRSSDALASAYGIAVTGTFMCTCVLAMVVFRRIYRWSKFAALGTFGTFFVIDGVFFAANALKIPQGGWVPLMLGTVLATLMTTWKTGRGLILARWKQDSLPLASFLARLPQSRTLRVPGIAIFLTANADFVPASLLHNLKHNKVLHERILFVTAQNLDQPEADAGGRMMVEEMAPGIHRVTLRYGFMESPNLPRALEELRAHGVAFDPMQASYFVNREVLVRAAIPKMPLWRMSLFLVMARNAVPAIEFFRIPSDRVVELGVRVAI